MVGFDPGDAVADSVGSVEVRDGEASDVSARAGVVSSAVVVVADVLLSDRVMTIEIVTNPATSTTATRAATMTPGRCCQVGRGGSISSAFARRSFRAEIGACCVGASEALSAAGSFATSDAWCDGNTSAPESSATASTDEVPASGRGAEAVGAIGMAKLVGDTWSAKARAKSEQLANR
jgi:hypothetical protein